MNLLLPDILHVLYLVHACSPNCVATKKKNNSLYLLPLLKNVVTFFNQNPLKLVKKNTRNGKKKIQYLFAVQTCLVLFPYTVQ